jgi:hypothetical protein
MGTAALMQLDLCDSSSREVLVRYQSEFRPKFRPRRKAS